MADELDGTKKPRGRPPVGGAQISLRLEPSLLQQLDDWIAKQPQNPGRQEAIKALIVAGLHLMGETPAAIRVQEPHSISEKQIKPKSKAAPKASLEAPPMTEPVIHGSAVPKFWSNLRKR